MTPALRHEASGSRRSQAENLIQHTASKLNTDTVRIIKAERGKGGSTWAYWLSRASFIQALISDLKVGISHLWKTIYGPRGSSWAHWQIALAYAKYLSPEFHVVANKAFREWSEEKADPLLKVE